MSRQTGSLSSLPKRTRPGAYWGAALQKIFGRGRLTLWGVSGIIATEIKQRNPGVRCMKKKPYVPIALAVGVGAILLLASFPPRWLGAAQDSGQSTQQPSPGPQPDVGETVVVPKKRTQPSPDQPANQPANQPVTVQPPEKHEKINPDEIYTLSTSTNLVNVDVMVVDNTGARFRASRRRISKSPMMACRKP